MAETRKQIRARKQRDARDMVLVASNKRARHDYNLEETFEAGLVLQGTEVKALRQGRASLIDGWVSVEAGEAWLEGVHIPEYAQGTWTNHAPRRRRKLLLHRLEIRRLAAGTREKGYTIVPLRLYFAQGRAKIEIALAKGKQEWDKRQALRERQDKLEAQRAIAHRDWR
ncbi:MAG: SsrA-binding protein SmpB [Bifidobacteriaceae bacterium]|jgi:SsrA-binding protein|nr:SsrA-binding protein SmpB [Bifidobacteriaceae bacterium]